jgi:hypothetical protein
MCPIPKRVERPRWNDWTTWRRVQFDYEDEAPSRMVRLTTGGTRVGEVVRVGMSGVEVEGRISAIDGTILRVTVSAHGAKKKMAKASARPSQRRRGKMG